MKSKFAEIVPFVIGFVGVLFIGAASNTANTSNDTVFLIVGVGLMVVGVALVVWFRQTGVMEVPPHAIFGLVLVFTGLLLQVSTEGLVSYLGSALTLAGAFITIRVASAHKKAAEPALRGSGLAGADKQRPTNQT